MNLPKSLNIFPLPPNKKTPPLLKNWQKTRYPREKLKEHKGNYGLGTGEISGNLIVFDWDFRKGFNRKEEGFKLIFEEFKKKLPQYAETLIVETPNGYHFYYIYDGFEPRNTATTNIGYDKKKFIKTNETRFSKWLAGVDTRGDGGYVVMPPSVVDGKKYKWYQEVTPKKITEEEYNLIFNFFLIDKNNEQLKQSNTIRQGFIDILEGKINPNEIKSKEYPEHVYWKEMYHECFSVAGLLPEDLYGGLETFQKGFDLEKTKKQIENEQNRDYIFDGKRLSDKKYREYFKLKKKKKKDNVFDTPLHCISYDRKEIQVYENKILLVTAGEKNDRVEKILDCQFEIFRKCFHFKEERFSYFLNSKKFYTDTILEIVNRAEPYLRKGLRGKDCLKEVISYFSKNIESTQAREFLGFDNGWQLPQTENENNHSLITITDFQQEAYERAIKIIKVYTEEEKNKIRELLKKFIKTTQVESINLIILIAWSMASMFRVFFIRRYDLFPILYNYGIPGTGRSSLEDFWIIDFFRIYKTHLPPTTTVARLEDHLSQAIFPHSFQDIKKEQINPDLISMLQDYSTSIGLFERKKSGKEVDFIKYKIAPLNLDSNYILELFTAPAINERQIFCNYRKRLIIDRDWIKLRDKLRKYHLFSFLYEHTKDWTDKNVHDHFDPILDNFTAFRTNSPRLVKSAAIIRFGLNLFQDAFNIQLGVSDDNIMNAILKGSNKMTSEIVDKFRAFCQIAIAYDETYQYVQEAGPNAYQKTHRGDNPRYINHKLGMNNRETWYAFTQSNLEDYKRRFSDYCGMEALVEKLHKGMDMNETYQLKYTVAAPYPGMKKTGIIKILPEFFNGALEQKQLDAKDLLLDKE